MVAERAQPRRQTSGVHSAGERAQRRARVEAAKDALQRSASLEGPGTRTARAVLKNYLRELDGPRQPSDAQFDDMLAAPFREPRDSRRG
jgi:hypothetical protein